MKNLWLTTLIGRMKNQYAAITNPDHETFPDRQEDVSSSNIIDLSEILKHEKRVKKSDNMNRFRSLGISSHTDTDLEYFFDYMYLDTFLKPGMKVLEIGCGCGNTLFDLVHKYKIKGMGIDLTDSANWYIHHARNKDANFRIGRANDIPFRSDLFDFVYSYMVVPYVIDKLGVIAEAHRVMKIGGKGIINLELEEGDRKYLSPSIDTILKKVKHHGQLEPDYVVKNKDSREIFSTLVKITKKTDEPLVFPEVKSSQEVSGVFAKSYY